MIELAHMNRLGQKQTLKEHSTNTYRVIEESASKLNLSCCMTLIAILHDCGKVSDDFQRYLERAVAGEQHLSKVNHSSAGAQVLFTLFKDHKSQLDNFVQILMAEAIISHHGLCDYIDTTGINTLHKRCYPSVEIPLDKVMEYLKCNYDLEWIEELYSKAKEEIGAYLTMFQKDKNCSDDRETSFYYGALQRLLLSMLIHGDREDTRAFMDDIPLYLDNNATSDWDTAIEKLEDYITSLNKTTEKNKINALRSQISEECLEASDRLCGVYRLSCPTGSGKTLASLRFALHHAKKQKKKRILYVAPYKTILEQNADVLKQFFAADEVLEHHSDMIPKDRDEYNYYCSNWQKPVIMTTAVRFFDTLFSDRTTDIRRFHQLADSVIIFDEVQSIPVRTIYMFNVMMNFLAKYCGTTLVLCTATQPLLEKVKYPIRLSENPDIVHNISKLSSEFKRVKLIDCCRTEGYSMSELPDFIFQNIKEKTSILTIVNTKSDALKLYKACQEHNEIEDIDIYHLSTNMCPEHRNVILKEAKDLLGKKTIICISTSLIEAGVDVSFDIVIRALSGLSSILQAAGRCNRHGGERLGTVYLVNSNSEYVDKLRDTKKGQDVIKQQLALLHRKSIGDTVDELLEVESINRYYRQYFFDRRNEMEYTTEVGGFHVRLFDLMSKKAVKEPVPNEHYSVYLGHALKTAGCKFKFIESNTIGVLVPYGRGEELITMLSSDMDNRDKYKILDEVQRYTINIYENKYKEFIKKGVIRQLEFNGMLILEDGYYEEDVGVSV